ncbi:MAG: DUF3883 domain-containing protein [Chthoniobacteraceae bacterium]
MSLTLSAAKFDEQFRLFAAAIEEKSGEPFVSFHHGLADEWEGYKQRIYREGRARLAWAKWKRADIGSGRILDAVIRAIEIHESADLRNNLVHWQAKRGPNSRSHIGLLNARDDHAKRKECEELLFQLYRREGEPGEIFEALTEIIGRRYDVLAYLFFLRDWEAFLPIAASIFDDAFARLGLDVRTSNRCSWENYQSYLAAIDLVKLRLRGKGFATARLVDAHSFCWMLVRLPSATDSVARPRRITMTEIGTLMAAPARETAATSSERPVDFTASQARREYLGDLGEAIAFEAEQTRLCTAGRADLADAVRIVSADHRLGYDIASFDADGSPRHIEVKAVGGSGNRMDFYVTENERRKSTELPNYWFYLVQKAESPRPHIRYAPAHSLPPDALVPVVYRASILEA